MNYDNIKFRASCIGKLMTDPRSKSETISETTKAYLVDVVCDEKYNRRWEIYGKALAKGTVCEEDSITILSRFLKKLYVKNETCLKNDFVKGTPDTFDGVSIESAEVIYDTKTPEDIRSFLSKQVKNDNKDYYWQMQAYMDLSGASVAYIAYCLVNSPQAIIESEKRKAIWSAGIKDDELPEGFLEQIDYNYTYDDIPLEERIYLVKVERNQEDIEKMHQRVVDCRKWLNENF